MRHTQEFCRLGLTRSVPNPTAVTAEQIVKAVTVRVTFFTTK